jgi:hypothetical protein
MTDRELELRRMGYLQQVLQLADRDADIKQFLHDQLHEILVYARLKGHEVQDWSENETYY